MLLLFGMIVPWSWAGRRSMLSTIDTVQRPQSCCCVTSGDITRNTAAWSFVSL